MVGLSKQQTLETLRSRIEDIEKHQVLAAVTNPPGHEAGFTLAAAMLHEVFTDSHRQAAASLGFAFAAARSLCAAGRSAVLYLQMAGEAQEVGFPYAPGIRGLGIDPDALIIIRPADIIELLWAAEEALACRAVAAVIADVASDPKALDFTASRRLALRAAASGSTMLMLRYGEAPGASAARMRWRLSPETSEPAAFDPRAPGMGRWRVVLEKGLRNGRPNQEWLLSWTENGLDILTPANTDRTAVRASLPRSLPAALGDRLAKTA